MPSPFPGMDPYLEFQLWGDFHGRFVSDLADALVPQVRPRYVVRYERRVYVEHDPGDPERCLIPDATVASRGEPRVAAERTGTATAAPVEMTLPMPVTKREAFLTLRERETLSVVTVIEVLSSGNKRPGSDGRREYLSKRDSVLQSSAHLVEIDLLRGGERLPTVEVLPPADYYAFVSRANRRPHVQVYPWAMRDRMPTIPVPLADDTRDAAVDLQEVFSSRYDRSGYDYSLRYDLAPDPPFSEKDAQWIGQLLKQ